MRHYMFMQGVGNPDFQQYAPIAPLTVSVCDDEDWGKKFKDEFVWYREEFNLGGGNCGFKTGAVWKKEGDVYEYVGRFSYNGRYWPEAEDEYVKVPNGEKMQMRRLLQKFDDGKGPVGLTELKEEMEREFLAFLAEAERSATT